jgi:hypothetical protein
VAPVAVSTLASMNWLVEHAGACAAPFAKRGAPVYLHCRPMGPPAAARRDLRCGWRLFLPRDPAGKPRCASVGAGFLWGPATCPACPGQTCDAWHRTTSCVETAPARVRAFRALDAAAARRSGVAGADGPATGDGAEFVHPTVREIWEQRDTQRGRVFVFLATLGCPLPGGKAGHTGLPASWAELLAVPAKPQEEPWAVVRAASALALTLPAFDCVALAAARPLELVQALAPARGTRRGASQGAGSRAATRRPVG